jgi:redox-regulated HSP33 family molecular chaperone
MTVCFPFQARRDYPAAVRNLLGEALAAATLLAATISIDAGVH